MLFSWWTNRRRRQILAQPFPPAWDTILDRVGHYALLPDADRPRLRAAVQIFLAEKELEGCRGLDITDKIRVTVAALASVLVLGMPNYYFDNVQSILVYPEAYVAPDQAALSGEATLYTESDRLGEAHPHGPVILAWPDVREAADRPGHGENLVFHEFAHQLDMVNGDADGVPRLEGAELRRRWEAVMEREFERLKRAADRGRRTLLDPYGATDPAEFFAVVTECFFDAPRPMRAELPELYALFRDYYRQDPATWDGWPEE